MNILLLRHAPTQFNLESRYMGKTDLPLAPEGECLAAMVQPRHDVGIVYTSGKQRTVQTARILYPAAAIRQNAGLDEMDFGAFEGRHWRELENDPAYSAWLASRCESLCPGGEDKAGFSARVCDAFLHCLRAEDDAGADEMHMVVHGGVIMAVCERFAVPRREYFDWKASYCGGFQLRGTVEGDGCKLKLIRSVAGPKLELA